MKKILVVAAHPDDEILGCGGTLARLIKEGYRVDTLILGEGITSRDGIRIKGKREQEIKILREKLYKANKMIGVNKVFVRGFPDNRLDSIQLLDIIKLIENVKDEFKPNIIFTHYWGDLNIDHQITYKAVLTACRPVKEETVREIYSFEVPSSTEWNYPNVFKPNVFMDISKTLDIKIKAFRCYDTELRKFPHPRSEEALRYVGRRWGSVVGLNYAEAFKIVRMIK
ncbi:MAG: PIG-L family deacetylase [Elusimicrobia bacterium]|nr:PIG-L family deacetylase [Elusimicrobiota bacterium]